MTIFLCNASITSAQLGDPIYSQTFGEGNADANTIGSQLNKKIKTDFNMIVHCVRNDCFVKVS